MPQAASFATGIKGEGLSETLKREIDDNRMNGVVGTQLISETDEVRVWHLRLPSGLRCAFHRHVLSYFWTCHSYGSTRILFEDGTTQDMSHSPGDTRQMTILPGEYMLHAVANTGPTELLFTTVEYKKSGNAPLPLEKGCALRLYSRA